MTVSDVSESQLFQGLEKFLVTFVTPAITDDGLHVIPGYVDDQTLPAGDNDFFVYTPIGLQRHGTTIEQWQIGDTIKWVEYVEATVQVDCYSSSILHALQRAQTLETVIRSEAAVDFLEQYGISPLFADSPRNLSSVMDSGRYVPRWSVDLHFGFWKEVQTDMEYFTDCDVTLVNTDVNFPPT